MSDQHIAPAPVDENQLILERREKLKAIRQNQAEGKGVAFPNDFKPADHALHLFAAHAGQTAEGLLAQGAVAKVAGRMMLKRVMGKASFCTLQDSTGRIQIYIKGEDIGTELYDSFKHWDLGDIVAAEGTMFKTKTGELSIHATSIRLLTKSLRPMPDKFHGINDQEVKYRQRYVDLMMDEEARKRFTARSKAVSGIRDFMVAHQFLEVETPMLHPIPGGANAKPFTTHHNALDLDLFLRVAPELYLKRLVVGGLERVYEINRNFRNEGVSTRHNPEFTMLEAYQAFGDFEIMADMVEELVCHLAVKFCGTLVIEHKNDDGEVTRTIDLSRPWQRTPYRDLLRRVDAKWWDYTPEERRAQCAEIGVEISPGMEDYEVTQQVFEKKIEEKQLNPCFVTHVPTELVPLAKQNKADGTIVDVYELIINGVEVSPGYSELNDPIVQRSRLEHQAGEETQKIDEDFLLALEHGMPPAGGIGIGIDRLVMMLTGSESIRDVVLFPQLKNRD